MKQHTKFALCSDGSSQVEPNQQVTSGVFSAVSYASPWKAAKGVTNVS